MGELRSSRDPGLLSLQNQQCRSADTTSAGKEDNVTIIEGFVTRINRGTTSMKIFCGVLSRQTFFFGDRNKVSFAKQVVENRMK